MNKTLRNTPLRVLLVEDSEADRKDCAWQLKKHFRAMQLDEAEDKDSADSMLRDAAKAGHPYDCAILDLKLPDQAGEESYVQTALAKLILDLAIRSNRGDTQILQWTAWPEADVIPLFQQDHRLKELGVSYELISKRDIKWPSKMRNYFDRLVAEKLVGRYLDDPYFNPAPGEVLVLSGRGGAGRRPPVNISALVNALIMYWNYLSGERQKQALDAFQGTWWEMAREGDGVRLTDERMVKAMEEAREITAFLNQREQPA